VSVLRQAELLLRVRAVLLQVRPRNHPGKPPAHHRRGASLFADNTHSGSVEVALLAGGLGQPLRFVAVDLWARGEVTVTTRLG